MITIRKQTEADKDQIWKIIRSVITTGNTYYFAPDSSKVKMLDFWFDQKKKGYVAISSEPAAAEGTNEPALKDNIEGIFYITENFPDLASHIGNAGYMVSPEARGKGVGRRMAEFSIEEARKAGFRAMQFNFVIKTNEHAVNLWLDLGFKIIGEIPDAFQTAHDQLSNALIMYRKL